MEQIKKLYINPSYEWTEDAKELGISHRELEVFALAFEGHNNKEIAAILGIQYQSVKNHLYSLSKKLKIQNVGQALVVLLFKNMVRMELPILKVKFTQENAIREFQKRIFDDKDNTFTDKQKRKIRNVMVELGIYGDMFKDRKKELEEGNY